MVYVAIVYLLANGSCVESEQMSLVQLFVPAEVAHDTVAELGELGDVQFKDVSYFMSLKGWYLLLIPSPVKSQRQSLPTLFCWRNSPC